jgi:hypothetical protein
MAAVTSCDDVGVHILSGELYDPALACLGPTAGVDVVQGGATGDNCAPTCLVATSGDSSFVYVTTTCPPYPGDYTSESSSQATDPSDPCTGAFAAYVAEAGCPPVGTCGDGGVEAAADGACPAGNDGGGDGASGEASSGADGGGDAGTE